MKTKSLFSKPLAIITSIIISIPVGAVLGTFLGLMATTFIPQECNSGGCHNSFEWAGKIGYEATGVIGFFIGIVVIPIIWIVILWSLKKKDSKK